MQILDLGTYGCLSTRLNEYTRPKEFMFYVYILRSKKDNNLYVGFSADLRKRFVEHNKGKVNATKNRLPLELIYYEAFKDELMARRQELFYKTGQGRRVLKKRLSP